QFGHPGQCRIDVTAAVAADEGDVLLHPVMTPSRSESVTYPVSGGRAGTPTATSFAAAAPVIVRAPRKPGQQTSGQPPGHTPERSSDRSSARSLVVIGGSVDGGSGDPARAA